MSNILVVAPHPDDETLGCAGTLLKLKAAGKSIHWLIVTDMAASSDYSQTQIKARQDEITAVSAKYGFTSITQLAFAPATLDQQGKSELVAAISQVVSTCCPQTVFIPFRNDVHSDHEVVFDACIAATKQFRQPGIKELFAYETLSETEYSLKPNSIFSPNYFVDINGFLATKLEIMAIYQSELADFPFPRSLEAISAQAKYRGAQSYLPAAEAFMLLRKIA